jgi:hypothetical protein
MSKKPVIKEVSDFNVEIADNGFVLNYSGRDADDDWANVKVVLTSAEQLADEINKIILMR